MSYCRYLALCIVFFSNLAWAEDLFKIKIGVNPNLWFAQVAVIKGENWDFQNNLDLEIVRFPGPSHNLQSFIGGHIDIMNNNVAAAILAKNKINSTRVFSSSMNGDSILMGRGDFSKTSNTEDAVKLMQSFCENSKRKIKLLTNPKGSLSDLNIKSWLSKNYQNYSTCIDFIYAADQSQLISIFLTGNVDIVSAFSPLQVIYRKKDSSINEFVSPHEIGKFQAGGVFVAQEKYLKKHSVNIQILKKLIDRATIFIKRHPEKAAEYVNTFLTQGLLEKEYLIEAIKEAEPYFSSDYRNMESSTKDILELMKADAYINENLNLDEIWY